MISPFRSTARVVGFKFRQEIALRAKAGISVTISALLFFSSCATIRPVDTGAPDRLRNTSDMINEVKAFGKTIGIEPTPALSRTTEDGPALSMLWLWLQRAGTLALRAPLDIRLAIGFRTEKERLRIEQVYRVDGYSVYYRQGNEFADSRSVATIGFTAEPVVRRVMVVLHEDLHGDANFSLPWEMEEAIVTPLGSLAALAYFRQKDDEPSWKNALAAVAEERKLSRELNALTAEAELIFATLPVDDAKQQILAEMSRYPTYRRQFERQIQGQHPPTVLEAKLSHGRRAAQQRLQASEVFGSHQAGAAASRSRRRIQMVARQAHL